MDSRGDTLTSRPVGKFPGYVAPFVSHWAYLPPEPVSVVDDEVPIVPALCEKSYVDAREYNPSHATNLTPCNHCEAIFTALPSTEFTVVSPGTGYRRRPQPSTPNPRPSAHDPHRSPVQREYLPSGEAWQPAQATGYWFGATANMS